MSALLKKRTKKLRFLADPGLFWMYVILLLIVWMITGWTIYVIENYSTTGLDEWIAELLFLLNALAMTVAATLASPQWGVVVTLTEQGISLKCPIRKREVHPYSEFPLVYRAYYIHGLVGAPDFGPKVVYIVLSKRRMSDLERRNINLIREARDLIIIKYSKRRYRKLFEILPWNLAAQMDIAFQVSIKRDEVALRRSKITAKARRRRTQKWKKKK